MRPTARAEELREPYAWPWKPRAGGGAGRAVRSDGSHGIPGASPPPTTPSRRSSCRSSPVFAARRRAAAWRCWSWRRRESSGRRNAARSTWPSTPSKKRRRDCAVAGCSASAMCWPGAPGIRAASATDAEAVLPPRAGDRLARRRRLPRSHRPGARRTRRGTPGGVVGAALPVPPRGAGKHRPGWRCCRRDWYASATGCGWSRRPGGARLRPGHALARALAPRSGPSLAARTHRRLGVTRRYASVVAAV